MAGAGTASRQAYELRKWYGLRLFSERGRHSECLLQILPALLVLWNHRRRRLEEEEEIKAPGTVSPVSRTACSRNSRRFSQTGSYQRSAFSFGGRQLRKG